jgi:hypothetical protein
MVIRVRVTKPVIEFRRDKRVKDAVAFLPCRILPAKYVWAKILRVKQ